MNFKSQISTKSLIVQLKKDREDLIDLRRKLKELNIEKSSELHSEKANIVNELDKKTVEIQELIDLNEAIVYMYEAQELLEDINESIQKLKENSK
jgi:hypothetical protein